MPLKTDRKKLAAIIADLHQTRKLLKWLPDRPSAKAAREHLEDKIFKLQWDLWREGYYFELPDGLKLLDVTN